MSILDIFKGKEGKEKKEKGINPELDIAQKKLEELQGKIGMPYEKAAREFRDSLIVDLRQLGITDIHEQAKYLATPMRLFDQLFKRLKVERVAQEAGLTSFLEDPSTYDKKLAGIIDAAQPKKAAKKWAKNVEKEGKKQGFLSGLIGGWLFDWANGLKKVSKGSDTWLSKSLRKLARLLGGTDQEKINTLTGEITVAIKEKDWDLVKEKANELLIEDEHHEKAIRALALAGKKNKALAGGTPGYEKLKHKKEFSELKGIIEFAEIPIEMNGSDYEQILRTTAIGGKPEKLKKVVIHNLKENGGIWSLNKAIEENSRLKKSDFEFSLLDFLTPTKKLAHVVKALNDADDTYKIKDLKNITPNKLRTFLTAVRTGKGLGTYKQTKIRTAMTMGKIWLKRNKDS